MKAKPNKLILALFSVIVLSCSKNESNPIDEAFSDLNDFSTTEIETTIPRVEVTQSGNQLTLLLSVTDQEGIPLQRFTLGNYQIEMTIEGNSNLVDKNGINLTELDEFSNSNPLAVAATLDYSGSMSSSDITDMENALRSFITIKSSSDQMSIIKFGSYVDQVQGFTSDTTLLNTAINTYHSVGSSTAFYSSCELGLEEADKKADVLPLVIGFTDGGDNNSTISLSGLISKSQALGIPIYTIGYGYAEQSNLLQLAEDTGGRSYFAPNGADIADLYSVINGQLKKLYILKWNVDVPQGTEITLKVTTEYTAANGAFTDVSIKTLTIQ